MSNEEPDLDLKDLVRQTLEANGFLPKMQAEIRANIFFALDEGGELLEPSIDTKLTRQLTSDEGRLAFCLVREFLEFFDLDFTMSVYDRETFVGLKYDYEGRTKLAHDLNTSQQCLDTRQDSPLLLQLIQSVLRRQQKNLEIDLSKLHRFNGESTWNEEEEEDEDAEKFVAKIKAPVASSLPEKPIEDVDRQDESVVEAPTNNLNETFCVNKPTDCSAEVSKSEEVRVSGDDTYEGTSSISEDSSSTREGWDKGAAASSRSTESEFSPPVLKEKSNKSLGGKSAADKLKPKNTLSSLADLPPLQMNKARNDSLLLPSLYSSKELKERSGQNLRELDRLLDMGSNDSLDNYEEDFMSESEINLNNVSTVNGSDETGHRSELSKISDVPRVEEENSIGDDSSQLNDVLHSTSV